MLNFGAIPGEATWTSVGRWNASLNGGDAETHGLELRPSRRPQRVYNRRYCEAPPRKVCIEETRKIERAPSGTACQARAESTATFLGRVTNKPKRRNSVNIYFLSTVGKQTQLNVRTCRFQELHKQCPKPRVDGSSGIPGDLMSCTNEGLD